MYFQHDLDIILHDQRHEVNGILEHELLNIMYFQKRVEMGPVEMKKESGILLLMVYHDQRIFHDLDEF